MFHAKDELCAGNKIPYPKMKVFQRKLNNAKHENVKPKYTYKLVKEMKNSVRKQHDKEHDFLFHTYLFR